MSPSGPSLISVTDRVGNTQSSHAVRDPKRRGKGLGEKMRQTWDESGGQTDV